MNTIIENVKAWLYAIWSTLVFLLVMFVGTLLQIMKYFIPMFLVSKGIMWLTGMTGPIGDAYTLIIHTIALPILSVLLAVPSIQKFLDDGSWVDFAERFIP